MDEFSAQAFGEETTGYFSALCSNRFDVSAGTGGTSSCSEGDGAAWTVKIGCEGWRVLVLDLDRQREVILEFGIIPGLEQLEEVRGRALEA